MLIGLMLQQNANVNAPIDDLNANVNARIDDLNASVNTRFANVYARFDDLNARMELWVTSASCGCWSSRPSSAPVLLTDPLRPTTGRAKNQLLVQQTPGRLPQYR